MPYTKPFVWPKPLDSNLLHRLFSRNRAQIIEHFPVAPIHPPPSQHIPEPPLSHELDIHPGALDRRAEPREEAIQRDDPLPADGAPLMREAQVVRPRRLRDVPHILLKGGLSKPGPVPNRPTDPVRKRRLDREMAAPEGLACREIQIKAPVSDQRDEELRPSSSLGSAGQRTVSRSVVLARVQDAARGTEVLPRGAVVTDLVEQAARAEAECCIQGNEEVGELAVPLPVVKFQDRLDLPAGSIVAGVASVRREDEDISVSEEE